MTTILKIIESIDLSKHGETLDGSADLPSVFGIQEYVEFDGRIKAVFVRPHYCTDSWVGVRAYFLDGEFVALCTQVGRKWDEEFEFVSVEAGNKVKDYIFSLLKKPEYEIKIAANLNEPIDDFYSVNYAEQILHKSGIYNGEKVRIKRSAARDWKDVHSVIIIGADGKEKKVDCREVLLAYVDLS
jgi:hypothetical protein